MFLSSKRQTIHGGGCRRVRYIDGRVTHGGVD